MTAACTTFDQVEFRAATSVALANRTRRVRDGFLAATLGKILLVFLNHKLGQLRESLRSGSLDNLSREQLQEVAALLKQLTTSLLRLVEDSELQSHRVLAADLSETEHRVEGFESILENIYLALDPEFKIAVSSAIDQLRLGVEESATVSR